MTRRLALAVALAFTTVVTFALVAVGAQAGLFGGGGKDGAPADAAAGQQATPEPTVITEYIYIDQTATPGPGSVSSEGGSGEVHEREDGDDEEFEEHEDEHEEFEHEEDDD
jgi:hypothetical protein